MSGLSKAEQDVLAERTRQVTGEGFTAGGDDQYDPGTLASAGTCYGMYAADMLHPMSQGDGFVALEGQPPLNWPWDANWWKPKDPRDAMVKAAALLIAEIEKMDRAAGVETNSTPEANVPKELTGMDVIPEMTDPLGKHWAQPGRLDILVRDGKAILTKHVFQSLAEYNTSFPSGVYPGKMWKRINGGLANLCWYGEIEGNKCAIHHMQIEVAAA